jgi:hypothetical protein
MIAYNEEAVSNNIVLFSTFDNILKTLNTLQIGSSKKRKEKKPDLLVGVNEVSVHPAIQ